LDPISLITIGLGAAWASGLNLYATVLILGGLQYFGILTLPVDLGVLAEPEVLIVAAFLYCVEFVVDKVPGFDSIWDAIHTFIRIPAGALMAAGAVGGIDAGLSPQVLTIAALVTGGALSGVSHITKTGVRAMANTSPEPISNWLLSVLEDSLVLVGTLVAAFKPVVFIVLLCVFLVLAIWLLPKVWRGLRSIFQRFHTRK
jgi:hypothetical protein